MKLWNKFAAAALLSASLAVGSAQPAAAQHPDDLDQALQTFSDVIGAIQGRHERDSFRERIRDCMYGAINNGDADYAATRILREFPPARPYVRHPDAWNDFRRDVAREMCRLEMTGHSRPIQVAHFSLSIEPRLLQRAPRYEHRPHRERPQGPVIIIPLPF